MQTVFQPDTTPTTADRMNGTTSILQIAQNYVDAGFSVIPIAANGTKRPASNRLPAYKWELFIERKPTPDELKSMFAEGVGIAVIHGAVSGNSEALDFDEPRLGYEYRDLLKSSGVGDLAERLVWIDTPSGGAQAWYRCTDPPKSSHHLAKQADGRKARIETRGERGYTVAPGSPGACHPTGNAYRVVHGDLTDLPVLSADERDILHGFSGLFNLYVEPESIIKETDYCADRLPGTLLRPGDDYNERGSVLELLERHGWRVQSCGAGYRLCRPGKDRGWSATFGIAAPRLLYCFTSGDQYFRENKGYLPFTIYVLLEHNGDASAAAKALYAQGYGDRAHVTALRPSENAARWIVPEAEDELDMEPDMITEEIEADDLSDIEAEEQQADLIAPVLETIQASDEEMAEEPVLACEEPITEAELSAPTKAKPLPGLILDIGNVFKNLPVQVTRQGLKIDANASARSRQQVFGCLVRLSIDSTLWFNFAVGDAYNALPGDYGAKSAYVEKHFKGYYQRFRQLASVARRWPDPLRREGVCWSFYEVTTGVQDPSRRELFMNRYVSKEVTLAELKAEVRLIKAAQKEAKERKEQAEERRHVRRLAELTPSDTEQREQSEDARVQRITPRASVATMPVSEVPSMQISLRESIGGDNSLASVDLAQVHAEVDALVALGYTPEILLRTLRQIHAQNVALTGHIVQPLIPSHDSLSMADSVPVLDDLDFAEKCENEIDLVQNLNKAAPQTPPDELPQITPSMPDRWRDAGLTEDDFRATQRLADALGTPLNHLSYKEAQVLGKLPSLAAQQEVWAQYVESKFIGCWLPDNLLRMLKRLVKEKRATASAESVPDAVLEVVFPHDVPAEPLAETIGDVPPSLSALRFDSEQKPKSEPMSIAHYDALIRAAKARQLPSGTFVLPTDPPIRTSDLNMRVIRITNAHQAAVENGDTAARREQLNLLGLCQQAWKDHEQQAQ